MRFSAKINDVNAFKEMLRALAIVNREATLAFTPEGIASDAMDVEHVTLVEWLLDKRLLSNYDYEEDTKISLDMESLMKFIDGFSKDDIINISLDEPEQKLLIASRVMTAGKSGRTKNFAMPLLDLIDDEVPKPKIFFKSNARIIATGIIEALKDASLVGDKVTISIGEEGLTLEARGDTGSAINVWEKGADSLIALKLEEPSRATFILDKIKPIAMQGAKCGDVVCIDLTTDMPIRLDFETSYGKLEYHLAPMIG